jgi:rubrerythrin
MADEKDDVMLLREILARELDTINMYQSLLGQATLAEVASFINHIVDEEKEHVAEAMELINKLDARQAARFGSEGHWQEQNASEPQPPDATNTFTVGSLRPGR